jgi:hypothetical protein
MNRLTMMTKNNMPTTLFYTKLAKSLIHASGLEQFDAFRRVSPSMRPHLSLALYALGLDPRRIALLNDLTASYV